MTTITPARENAMCEPSGDQTASVSAAESCDRSTRPAPSGRIEYTSPEARLERLLEITIAPFRPGNAAGAEAQPAPTTPTPKTQTAKTTNLDNPHRPRSRATLGRNERKQPDTHALRRRPPTDSPEPADETQGTQ